MTREAASIAAPQSRAAWCYRTPAIGFKSQKNQTLTADRLAAHGPLGKDALRAIHLAAVRDVSRPLLAALFELDASNATNVA